MPTITPFFWFDAPLDEPIEFYRSVFRNVVVQRQSSAMATFDIEGQRFHALNGGPRYRFTEAVSFFIECADQDEVDHYWDRLTADGGTGGRCGWLKDRFGLSWQVIPTALGRLLGHSDRETAGRVTEAMLAMRKIDVAALERAAAGPAPGPTT